MPSLNRGGLLAFLLRVAPPPDADADAALLGRFAQHRDEAAFAALVRRHGPMVLNACRRRLGDGPDAEDAFQATFLALARGAAAVARNLPGWLYRAAYLIALKAAARRRGQAPPLAQEVEGTQPTPEADAQTTELRAALDAELAALPERLRAVVVLCLLEGRTNTEAAAQLGVPKGTVDSRLSAARKRLQSRLVRRGAAAAAAGMLDQMTVAPAAAGFDHLLTQAVTLASAFAAGAVGPELKPITSLADGVQAMTTTTRKLVAVALFGTVLLAGFGVYQAAANPADPAAEPPKKEEKKPDPAKADAAKLPATPKPGAGKLEAAGRLVSEETRTAMEALDQSVTIEAELDTIPLRDLMQQLSKVHRIEVRLDEDAFGSAGVPNANDAKPVFKDRARGMTVRDLIRATVSTIAGGVGGEVGIEVQGLQVIVAPSRSKDAKSSNPYNRSVTFLAEGKELAQVLTDLRRQTGATIVLDERAKGQGGAAVSGMFNDTRLMTVLKVLGDMCELEPVLVDTVFYLTTPENAKKLRASEAGR